MSEFFPPGEQAAPTQSFAPRVLSESNPPPFNPLTTLLSQRVHGLSAWTVASLRKHILRMEEKRRLQILFKNWASWNLIQSCYNVQVQKYSLLEVIMDGNEYHSAKVDFLVKMLLLCPMQLKKMLCCLSKIYIESIFNITNFFLGILTICCWHTLPWKSTYVTWPSSHFVML